MREKQEAMTKNLDPVIVDLPYTPDPYDDFYWMPTTRNLDSVIVDLPYTPMMISTGCQIVHLDHQKAKVLSSKLKPIWVM